MLRNFRAVALLAATVIAADVFVMESNAAAAFVATREYCVRLLGKHGSPVATKPIQVASDEEARVLAGQFLDEYNSHAGSSNVAIPFIAVEGHPCDETKHAKEFMKHGKVQKKRRHHGRHRRHHHVRVRSAAASATP